MILRDAMTVLNWLETWDCMESECRDEAVLIPFSAIKDSIKTHLKRHRFCSECADNVKKAFTLMIETGQVWRFIFHCFLTNYISGACQGVWGEVRL